MRLPSAEAYAAQVAKEQAWLPRLAPALTVPIPVPLALGRPGCGYPSPWSIYRWLPGETAASAGALDSLQLARDLAGFLAALQSIDPIGGPAPGPHNCHRGAHLSHYDGEVREAVARLGAAVDATSILAAWNSAAATRWRHGPVWLHGDVSPDNLLVRNSRLAAVIDFGCCGVGGPACDLAIAWSFFDVPARAAFREALPLDPDTWERGRGWALWKALVTLADGPRHLREGARRTLDEALASRS